MPLAADEVLLYPRRRRYFVDICIGFACTKIYSCRERIYPFRMLHLPTQLIQRYVAEVSTLPSPA